MILKGFKKETHVFFAGIPSNIGTPSKQIDFNGAQTDPNVIWMDKFIGRTGVNGSVINDSMVQTVDFDQIIMDVYTGIECDFNWTIIWIMENPRTFSSSKVSIFFLVCMENMFIPIRFGCHPQRPSVQKPSARWCHKGGENPPIMAIFTGNMMTNPRIFGYTIYRQSCKTMTEQSELSDMLERKS